MASKDKLIIHNLNFEIEFASESEFKPYADKISKLTNYQLPSAISEILKKYNLPGGDLIIKKLEIDLGNIPTHAFEQYILNAIASEIDLFLKKHVSNLKEEISQAKFRPTSGGHYELDKTEFFYRSDVKTERSTMLTKEIQAREKEIIDLKDYIIADAIDIQKEVIKKSRIAPQQNEINLDSKEEPIRSSSESEFTIKDESQKENKSEPHSIEGMPAKLHLELKDGKQREKLNIEPDKEEELRSAERLPVEPKRLTPLDKALIYYLKYGRLPSNVKYELGTSMLDVFNLNHQQPGFSEAINKEIRHDNKAKVRLNRLLDQTKSESKFDPRIPRAFEDYFTALVLDLSDESFQAHIRRFDINDMIRFIYADNPNKLKSLLKYLIIEYDSDRDWKKIAEQFFKKISKPSIVKVISSFVRKGAYVNKHLNSINRESGGGLKNAHLELFKILLKEGDTSKFDFDIKQRNYFGSEPKYAKQIYEEVDLVDYYLRHHAIPFSSGIQTTVERIDFAILSLGASQIKKLSIFANNDKMNYEIFGNLSEKALLHMVKAFAPNTDSEIKNKYLYFKYNIEGGVPEKFQKAFMLYYARKEHKKSYLEEMVNYWMEQFGDAKTVLQNRWKLSEEVSKELNLLLALTKEKVEDELKVDFTYDNYAQDISVKNAGLVILWPFLKIYFNMLELLDGKGNFRSMEERARACHLLQYLAIKRSYGEEFYYPLNKILTGYPLDESLPYEIKMTEKEIDVSNALLNNVLKQWNALKSSSVDGLRGSFLIRDGILTPSSNGWLLTVEKKAYDILMDKLPWGIGMIKLSWAPYVVSVEWERNIM
ncbi:contractile injection system tape measure protein [Portibacter marinus]|uniref:contractile injection system tape measure protein n=1 Tax=Portibacter marinus TaxID=2898660 RepID=UPI001EEE9124|nr:contractile injection system tape measure protein [Portibacter marinus]